MYGGVTRGWGLELNRVTALVFRDLSSLTSLLCLRRDVCQVCVLEMCAKFVS
jgi:hypothetical protein